MLVLTVQKKEYLDDILSGTYRPNLLLSEFALCSKEFRHCYNEVLSRLNKLSYMQSEDSCFWGWVSNPFLQFFYNRDDMVGIFTEVDNDSIVLSDYDKYTDYILGYSNNTDFFVNSNTMFNKEECIQGSFLNIGRVLEVVDLKLLLGLSGTVEDMLSSVSSLN